MDETTGKFVEKLHAAAKTGEPLELPLETDDRVLARVTDGIYRQPASAIRELIANAYDADATKVVVLTDAPRFSKILVRDNGNGMSAEVLINMIQHIGGSAKRTAVGQSSGVTDPDNPNLSPNGRKLIGKIGIGLFSVSQLTRQFTIITKPKTEDYRYTAVVTLHRYTDEDLPGTTHESKFRAGETVLTSEKVGRDVGHGTTIVLGELIPRARRVLQSADMWTALRNPNAATKTGIQRVRPAVHSGWLAEDGDKYAEPPEVPWTAKLSSDKRMRSLSDRLLKAAESNELHAQIAHAFDYYYRMVWSLGLALPVPYVGEHPFDLPGGSDAKCFLLSNRNEASGTQRAENQASALATDSKTSAGTAAGLPSLREGKDFRVEIDGLRLLRPIRYDVVRGTSRALQTPLLFVGRFSPDLSKFDKHQRGGHDLEFSGYFFWSPRVVPKEHSGLLIRINGASGTLFDSTFLNYQVAEERRLRQIVGEIFVSKGLEEALNIDRESFNTAHPHYQIVLNWVHNALRQVFNKQKDLESTLRTHRRAQTAARGRSAVQKVRDEELEQALGEEQDTVSDVVFTDDPEERAKTEKSGARVFPLTKVVLAPVVEHAGRVTDKTGQRAMLNQERATALVQLLDAYDLLDKLTPDQQADLVRAILRIFNTGE